MTSTSEGLPHDSQTDSNSFANLIDLSDESVSQSLTSTVTQSVNQSATQSVSQSVTPSVSQSMVTHSPATKQRMFGSLMSRIKKSHENSESMSALMSPKPRKNSERLENCFKCVEREEQLVSLSDDLSAVENELQASREVIKLLQQQLEISNSERKLLQDICKNKSEFISKDYLKCLSESSEKLTKLGIDLRECRLERDGLKSDCESVRLETKRLKDEMSVLKEMLLSKDETVVNLTHQIFDLENENKYKSSSRQMSNTALNTSNDCSKIKISELESLRDTVKAFEIQNELLNREIVKLNETKSASQLKELESQTKICDLEAKCSQVQSKLLALLKEINQSNEQILKNGDKQMENKIIAANESVQLLVNRLLEETSLDIPLSWRPGNKTRKTSAPAKHCNYDDLGFYHKPDEYYDNFDQLMTNVGQTRIKNSDNDDTKMCAIWRSKWDSYVGHLSDHGFQRTQELKSMLRTGIPQEYRCKIWKGLIYIRVKDKQNSFGTNYYQNLLKKNPTTGSKCDPSVKQIELDLLRTLPNNKHFESLESDGTSRLRRVLTAYSRHNQAVGYCQGLNRLAAVALLVMPEEDAFWCLVAIIETIMPPDYFGRNLLGAHVDQYVLRYILAEKLPRLHYHFECHGIELSLFSWFLTVFVDNIPVSVYLRIWDVFLYEGNKVLFRFAIAFLKLHEEVILQMNDSVSINQFLRTLGERTCDVRQLCNIAFCQLNPFPYRIVKIKRQYYSNLVKSELEKLDQIRQSLPNHDNSFDCDSD